MEPLSVRKILLAALGQNSCILVLPFDKVEFCEWRKLCQHSSQKAHPSFFKPSIYNHLVASVVMKKKKIFNANNINYKLLYILIFYFVSGLVFPMWSVCYLLSTEAVFSNLLCDIVRSCRYFRLKDFEKKVSFLGIR